MCLWHGGMADGACVVLVQVRAGVGTSTCTSPSTRTVLLMFTNRVKPHEAYETVVLTALQVSELYQSIGTQTRAPSRTRTPSRTSVPRHRRRPPDEQRPLILILVRYGATLFERSPGMSSCRS